MKNTNPTQAQRVLDYIEQFDRFGESCKIKRYSMTGGEAA